MKTFIANFGSGNWAWPECLRRNVIATMDDIRVGAYWESSDLEGYIRESLRLLKNRHGKPLERGTVTHWFNQVTWLHESNGDLWLHSDTKHLWWTLSLPGSMTSEVRDEPDPSFGSQKINFYCKPCQSWSSKDKQGRELLWVALHPRAKMFLMNQGTFQPVLNQNAAYAMALVEGTDLSVWHDLPEWQARAEKSGEGTVRSFSPTEIAEIEADRRMRQTAARMIKTAQRTALQSGQELLSVTKDKRFLFPSDAAAQEHALELMKKQEGQCALTGLKLLLDDEPGDDQCRYSLDRIDSAKHYEPGNLQVVCKFVNKWKGATDNEVFKRLIKMIRSSATSLV
jgi:hypothetical protein